MISGAGVLFGHLPILSFKRCANFYAAFNSSKEKHQSQKLPKAAFRRR